MSQYALLAVASKVLYEREVIELRKEVERLKLSLFWKDYNAKALKKKMNEANHYHAEAPGCNCPVCVLSDGSDAIDYNFGACLFKPWFEAKLVECGIETTEDQHPPTAPESFEDMDKDDGMLVHECDSSNFVRNKDAHLVTLLENDWRFFTYGSRLFRAKSVNNPELKKLARLFEILDQ
jgi:hypothetical protein